MDAESEEAAVDHPGAGAGVGRTVGQRFADTRAPVVGGDPRVAAAAGASEATARGFAAKAVPGDMAHAESAPATFDRAVAGPGEIEPSACGARAPRTIGESPGLHALAIGAGPKAPLPRPSPRAACAHRVAVVVVNRGKEAA